MRKLGAKNIRAFIIFSIIVVLLILIFAYCTIKVLSYDKKEYDIAAETDLFDKEYSNIHTKVNSKVYQNWDGNYYLKTDKYKYNLGNNAVLYNSNESKITLFGTMYLIKEDGTVDKKVKKNEILKGSGSSLYKIADRKYLIISRKIQDTAGNELAENYLVLVLDKQGKALIINNEINTKILNEMLIKVGDYTFDVANEKLTYKTKEIDLKKIIGSTNQYEKKKESTTKTNNSVINNGNTVTETTTDDKEEEFVFQKSVSLKNITSGVNYIDIDYTVIDPGNTYDNVFIILSDGQNSNKIFLNKDETNYRIYNLSPNFEYTVSLGYAYIDKENQNTVVEEMQDVVKIKTEKPNYTLNITKITNSTLYFNLKIDPNYKIESGNIVLYSDNQKLTTIPASITNGMLTNGWDGSIEISNLGYEIVLKLENTMYNGNSINLDVKTKYINY